MTKTMIVGRNKRKINQEGFYLGKYEIKLTHDYHHLGLDFYEHGYFEPSSKKWQIACRKALMAAFRKRGIVRVTCGN